MSTSEAFTADGCGDAVLGAPVEVAPATDSNAATLASEAEARASELCSMKTVCCNVDSICANLSSMIWFRRPTPRHTRKGSPIRRGCELGSATIRQTPADCTRGWMHCFPPPHCCP